MLSSLRRSSIVAIAALALVAGAAPVMASQPALVASPPCLLKTGKRSLFGGMHASTALYRRKSAGISVAQAKRNARKARNVARNRRNHR